MLELVRIMNIVPFVFMSIIIAEVLCARCQDSFVSIEDTNDNIWVNSESL